MSNIDLSIDSFEVPNSELFKTSPFVSKASSFAIMSAFLSTTKSRSLGVLPKIMSRTAPPTR